jgi:hypothetical protein
LAGVDAMKELPWLMKMYEVVYLVNDQEQKTRIQAGSLEAAKATFLFLTSENGIDKVLVSLEEER